MAAYNKVLLIGNLTRDPEIKLMTSGTPVCNFGLAVSEKYTDKNTGEAVENVCFVDVEAWSRQAEIAAEYLSKGSPVFIEGSLKYDTWEDKDGNKRNKLKVRLHRLQLIGQKKDSDEEGGSYQTSGSQTEYQQSAPKTQPKQTEAQKEYEEDVPF